MSRSFYCHQCATNVEINLDQWTCTRCGSGFIEELNQPRLRLNHASQRGPDVTFRRNPAVNRAPPVAAPPLNPQRPLHLLQQMLHPMQPPTTTSQAPPRLTIRDKSIVFIIILESQTSPAFAFTMTPVGHGTARHNYGQVCLSLPMGICCRVDPRMA